MTGELLIWGEKGSYRIDYSRIPQATENARSTQKALLGAGRFELPTPCAQGGRATRLRYAPTFYFLDSKLLLEAMQ